jgi:peptidyl-prolyl cis-trans isomerase B (cyclophilin B)
MSKAIIKTEKGDMTVEFFDKDAPNTVANFLEAG